MSKWIWVAANTVVALHDEQIAEHGGGAGLRDEGLLASALARAQNLGAYSKPDFADLAAAYGYGIARNHPFVDGNKPTAAVAMELFLEMNGYDLTASDEALVITILTLADGSLDEAALADWIRQSSQRVKR